MTAGLASLNGTQLYYEVVGDGPPLVLIHAGIADARMWDDLFPHFAQAYRVVRYDLRGFYRSPMVPGPFANHADLLALLDLLDLSSAHLVGVSMGGGLAIDFALEYPDRVASLVLVASALGGSTPSETLRAAWEAIDTAAEGGDLDLANELELRLWIDGVDRTAEEVTPGVRDRVREMNGQVFAVAEAYGQGEPQRLNPPAIERLGEIAVPTLIIVGDRDVLDVRQNAERLVNGIPGARKAVLTNVAHLPPMERPAEFAQLVDDFLKEH